jgi:glycosyltransferase involved in cell wall biosynthesis
MRILFHTSDPDGTAAYSNQAREIIKRLKADGHSIRLGTKHPDVMWRTLADGTEVFEGTNIEVVNEMLRDEHFDYILTAWDTWALHDKRMMFTSEKWVQWLPVDTEFASQCIATVAKESALLVAMSRHGERELRRLGNEPWYVPCGIDTETFRPKPEGRAAFRAEFGLTDEDFVIGSVGLNYEDDRKGFVPLMRAFKVFHERHPKSRLYLHTLANERNHVSNAINLFKVSRDIGMKEGSIIWANQPAYFMNRITPEWLADCYNGMDVFALATKGEGFGIPAVEAQACGVPAILSDTTTGPELVGPGWLIPIDPLDDARWLATGCERWECRPSNILATLEAAYAEWTGNRVRWNKRKVKSRENALAYDWETVWKKHFRPLLAEMDRRLKQED